MWPRDAFVRDFDYERVKADLDKQASPRESRRLYSAEDGLPCLKESWVVFLDLLGTTRSMPSLNNFKLREDLLLLDRLRWFLVDEQYGTHQQALSFSDHVVIGEPVRPGDELLQLGSLLSSVASYQLNLANRGIFLRGGVAKGPLYMDSRMVTGQGLIDAYNIENEIAIYPRVVVEKSVASKIRDDRSEDWPRWSWSDTVLVDNDGEMFVSYLPVIAHDEIPGDVDRGLKAHRLAIEEGAKANRSDRRILDKYEWTRRYHNLICTDVFPNHPGCEIPPDVTQTA